MDRLLHGAQSAVASWMTLGLAGALGLIALGLGVAAIVAFRRVGTNVLPEHPTLAIADAGIYRFKGLILGRKIMDGDFDLKPAAEIARDNRARQPNESAEYRRAREALLAEEIELNRHIARVAAQRRALPPGGEVKGDYEFLGEASSVHGANPVGVAELFGDKDTLFVYNWMYGSKRARPCPMCTALLSAVNGNADHIRQRIAMAVVGLSPIERQVAFKVERGWHNLPMYADVNSKFSKDYHGIMDDGTDTAAYNVSPAATGSFVTSGARSWDLSPPTPARIR